MSPRVWRVLVALVAALVAVAFLGCPPAPASPSASTRAELRAVVAFASSLEPAAVAACVRIAADHGDSALDARCRADGKAATLGLSAATDALDAWGATDTTTRALCAGADALAGLDDLAQIFSSVGANPPSGAAFDDVLVTLRRVFEATANTCAPGSPGRAYADRVGR